VAAAAHRDQQILARGKLHRSDHIGGAGAACEQRGMAIECTVPDATCNLIAFAGARQHRSALVCAEIHDVCGLESDGAASARDRRQIGGFGSACESRTRHARRGHEGH
jgi:hypothetical protein